MNRLLSAVFFATQKHLGQFRRGEKIPYIYHPLSVAILLSQVTKDKEVIIAGLLHDILEDTKTSSNELEKLFGKKVLSLVLEVTDEDKSLSWIKRKRASLRRIKSLTQKGALVKSADFLHNTYDLKRNIAEVGTSFFKIFHGPAKDKIRHYRKKLRYLKKYHPNPFLEDVEVNLKSILELIKRDK